MKNDRLTHKDGVRNQRSEDTSNPRRNVYTGKVSCLYIYPYFDIGIKSWLVIEMSVFFHLEVDKESCYAWTQKLLRFTFTNPSSLRNVFLHSSFLFKESFPLNFVLTVVKCLLKTSIYRIANSGLGKGSQGWCMVTIGLFTI